MTHVRNYCEQYRSGITGNIREHLPQVIMWQYSRTSSQYLMTTCVLMWQYSRTRMYLVREYGHISNVVIFANSYVTSSRIWSHK